MAVIISYKSFWAVIALFFFWVILSCRRASNTIFSIPKRKILRTNTFVCVSCIFHLSPIDGFTLTLIVDWVHHSWGLTFKTFASSCDVVVSMVCWTRFTFVIDGIKEVWNSTSHTIIVNFNESFWTARLDLIIIPA